jgi:hypothetical protein
MPYSAAREAAATARMADRRSPKVPSGMRRPMGEVANARILRGPWSSTSPTAVWPSYTVMGLGFSDIEDCTRRKETSERWRRRRVLTDTAATRLTTEYATKLGG